MKPPLLIALFLAAAGCGRKQEPSTPMANPELLGVVLKITAEHLHKPAETLSPDGTFGSLGADDLDLVEITMAAEDRLGIAISDDELTKAAGTTPDQKLADRLTLRAFATVVAAAPRQSKPNASNNAASGAGNLREAQVGVYGELSKLPNPHGYEIVFVPSLELLTVQSEKKLGRRLTESERDTLKQRAAVIALPPAEDMKRKRAQREGAGGR